MKKLLILILPAVLMFSCNNVTELPQVTTTNPIVSDTAVIIGGDVTFTEGDNKTTRGVLVDELINKGTDEKPTMYFESALFNGLSFDVYEDGQLKSEANYKDGKQDALEKFWSVDGKLTYEANYKDGKQDGLEKRWFAWGTLGYEANYKDGKQDGVEKFYFETGQLDYQNYWKDGKQIGSTRPAPEEELVEESIKGDI